MKRKQHALPGLFDTAEEAAVMLAVVKKQMKAHNDGNLVSPPKQDTSRTSSAARSWRPCCPRLPRRSL